MLHSILKSGSENVCLVNKLTVKVRISPLRQEARDSSVHGAATSHRVGVRDDDEGGLLQERDLDMKLLWNTL